ncbi:MAG: PIN domain-containing protein [Leptospirales bacterium]
MNCLGADRPDAGLKWLCRLSMYLLDTNIVSELRKVRPHGAVLSWLEGVDDSDLHLCSVTLGEIQSGIEITREQDAIKAAAIESWADQVAVAYNVLSMDAATFRIGAKLMHRQSDAVYEDALIAACAIRHNLTVVTRNVRDFERFQIPLFNPFVK